MYKLLNHLPEPKATSWSNSVKRFSVLMSHVHGARRTVHSTSTPYHYEEVLFTTEEWVPGGRYHVITLNRPKSLNALNYNMAGLITKDLKSVEQDDSIPLVVIKGSGTKAFCAGGDIIAVTEAGKVGGSLSKDFFRAEYSLNHYIGTYKKPFIAIIDGITMGGGVGLSVHGPFRIATEHTLFAMPETFIGLFPDVGGSHFLPKLKGKLGMYLALTGYRLKGRDVYHAGVATHLIAREKLPELAKELGRVCKASVSRSRDVVEAAVQSLLDQFHQQSIEVDGKCFSLDPYVDNINSCFGNPSMEGILDALQSDGSKWARDQLKTLGKMSPTSLKVTCEQLQRGAGLSFRDCFKMEYRMTQACMAGNDFYEGVRAVLIDKDNDPKWKPSTLAEVSPDLVRQHFDPPPDGLELELLQYV